MPPTSAKIKTVNIAKIIKLNVANIEREEKRLIPHIPWPLVHPFPILVPTPTNKPPKINKGKELVKTLSISLPENENKIGPITKPIKNNKLSYLF